jgi:hypothetical protein
MSTGAAASYTPYRHDSAAVLTGGGGLSMVSEATGDDAMWITVRRCVHSAHISTMHMHSLERERRLACGVLRS